MQKIQTTQAGFTLMELMVTVAIAAIVLGMAVPSFNDAMRSNRLTSNTNDLITALNLARSESVKRGRVVAVKAKNGVNWEQGWDVFVDANSNGLFDAGETLLRTYSGLPTGFTLRGNTLFNQRISFQSSGQASGSGLFVLCDNRDGNMVPEARTSKLVMVLTTGRARIMPDTDSPPDDIPDDSAGVNIDKCNP